MDPNVIRHQVDIRASPGRVWPYAATSEGHRLWCCPTAVRYQVLLEARVGGRYEERGTVGGEEWVNVGEVVAYAPPRLVAWTFGTRRADGSLGPAQQVTIHLRDGGDRTQIILEHRCLEPLRPELWEEARRRFEAGWGQALETLRALLASGPDSSERTASG